LSPASFWGEEKKRKIVSIERSIFNSTLKKKGGKGKDRGLVKILLSPDEVFLKKKRGEKRGRGSPCPFGRSVPLFPISLMEEKGGKGRES